MLTLDGSMGEGGGQILRTALALSSVTGTPFRIRNIRAARSRPGLGRQHLTAVQAAVEVTGADVDGAQLGSTDLTFRPTEVSSGDFQFSTDGAGSTTLVLQTILPPLVEAPGDSRIVLEGGTHNPSAPPFEFVAKAFLPLLERMGCSIELELNRPGFYPAGGGRIDCWIEPSGKPTPLALPERGPVVRRAARAVVSDLPRHIAERELETVGELLDIPPDHREVVEVQDPRGPGNVLLVEVECEKVTEVFTGFGKPGVPAEEVATGAAEAAREWEAADVAVGPQLADQLLLPLARAGGGSFTTVEPTTHAETNAEVIRRFLDVEVAFEEGGSGRWQVIVG